MQGCRGTRDCPEGRPVAQALVRALRREAPAQGPDRGYLWMWPP